MSDEFNCKLSSNQYKIGSLTIKKSPKILKSYPKKFKYFVYILEKIYIRYFYSNYINTAKAFWENSHLLFDSEENICIICDHFFVDCICEKNYYNNYLSEENEYENEYIKI
jgi:hypothetical protein